MEKQTPVNRGGRPRAFKQKATMPLYLEQSTLEVIRELSDRPLARVQVAPESVCWRWTGYCMPSGSGAGRGYGVMSYEGRPRLVHRLAYLAWIGPLVPGLTIDHVKAWGCRHLNCCAPHHI